MIGRVVGRSCNVLQLAGLTTRKCLWFAGEKPKAQKASPPKGRHTNNKRENQRYERGAQLLKQRIEQQGKGQAASKGSGTKKPEDSEKEGSTDSAWSQLFKRRRLLVLSFLFGWTAVEIYDYLFGSQDELTFERMLAMLEDGQITKIHIENLVHRDHVISTAAIVTPNRSYRMKLGNIDTFKSRIEVFNNRSGFKVLLTESRTEKITILMEKINNYARFALEAILLVATLLTIKKIFKTSNIESIGMPGPTSAKPFKPHINLETRFKDVAGLADAKLEITEFVDFLKNPQKYKELGARIPKGALLSGPPGTGKTMLAKACSGEAGVPFFSVSGSEFVEIFVGVGASRVRDLFKAAKSKTPSIVFIDEIDAIGRKREGEGRGGNDQRANTLNQLLVEMDGFGTSTDVIVLAATNRKELLDSALTRPGRFDRSIEISLPDLEGRKEIFLIHLKPIKLSKDKSIEEYAKRLATLTPGFSGADIYNICNEAAILSARQNKSYVESIDFQMATERVIGGVEKKKIITEKQRRTVAYHECGHAVVSWFLEGAHPLLKLTIIPRSKGALGFAQYLPSESQLESKQELLDKVCVILGGRCAEEHFFKRVTTGAQDDLQKVYKLSRSLVVNYGMSDSVGYVSPRESQYEKDYSEKLNETIDEEITRISKECTERTRKLVQEHADKIEKLAERLLQKETLDSKDICQMLGQRPFPPKSNYRDYLEQTSPS